MYLHPHAHIKDNLLMLLKSNLAVFCVLFSAGTGAQLQPQSSHVSTEEEVTQRVTRG